MLELNAQKIALIVLNLRDHTADIGEAPVFQPPATTVSVGPKILEVMALAREKQVRTFLFEMFVRAPRELDADIVIRPAPFSFAWSYQCAYQPFDADDDDFPDFVLLGQLQDRGVTHAVICGVTTGSMCANVAHGLNAQKGLEVSVLNDATCFYAPSRLALHEPDAEGRADEIASLEKCGIRILNTNDLVLLLEGWVEP